MILNRFFLETLKGFIKLLIRRKLCTKLISRTKVLKQSITKSKSISYIRKNRYDIGLHCYPTIYREEIINCFRLGILNAHIGLLPQLRGRSVTEWGLILGIKPTVSTFFIDTGIDTGTSLIIKHQPAVADIGINDLQKFKAHLFHLDAKMYKSAIVSIVAGGSFVNVSEDDGLRFYRVSKLLETVAQTRLLNIASVNTPSTLK